MAISPIPVDQRVIDIDSRRFASIEKALVELITNSDESYARLEKEGIAVSGQIRIRYERHQNRARLVLTDQAEGMSFEQVSYILTYGGAHSPLSRGEGEGRGYFGRGLKQAVYGLGRGSIETIHEGEISHIELYRSDNGGYLYDDGGGGRPAEAADYERLGIVRNGTRVTILIENAQVNISRFHSLVQAVADNIYLRDVLERRDVELLSVQQEKELERSGRIRHVEPPALILIGPDQGGHFIYGEEEYPFTLTLKRSRETELILKGDQRTNGLIIASGLAVLDCQLFEYENQVGAEYLFGTVRCPALIEKLGQGMAIISDEREGLNAKNDFVEAFSHAISRMIEPCVVAEQEKLKHLEHATTSDRTGHMIEHLLQRMSRAAIQDMGILLPPAEPSATGADGAEVPAALRFSTPFYYRRPEHPFHVTLHMNPDRFGDDDILTFSYTLPPSIRIEPMPSEIPFRELQERGSFEWSVVGARAGERGEIMVRGGAYWAWCEISVAEEVSSGHGGGGHLHAAKKGVPRDHGMAMFAGYDFRNLNNELERAVYSPQERKIIINTGAPTVQLYVDGRGHFRDSARLLLAELFMDVISDELARCTVDKTGRKGDLAAYHEAKQDIIRRYGSEIHLSFLNT
ncbi:MAG: ATP-binding protein [Campylobacterales bacterium]|nr:ATP-binding protein [Campylobacterales bacterium]